MAGVRTSNPESCRPLSVVRWLASPLSCHCPRAPRPALPVVSILSRKPHARVSSDIPFLLDEAEREKGAEASPFRYRFVHVCPHFSASHRTSGGRSGQAVYARDRLNRAIIIRYFPIYPLIASTQRRGHLHCGVGKCHPMLLVKEKGRRTEFRVCISDYFFSCIIVLIAFRKRSHRLTCCFVAILASGLSILSHVALLGRAVHTRGKPIRWSVESNCQRAAVCGF